MARYSAFGWTPIQRGFSRGRRGQKVIALVIHSAVAQDRSTHATFASGIASTHFIVHQNDTNGPGHQFVDTNNTAWSNGNRLWNQRTVTTELEGGRKPNYSEPLTSYQYQELVKWVYWSLKEHGLGRAKRGVIVNGVLKEGNLLEHNQIVGTACPSGRVVWAPLIKSVNRMFDKEKTMPSDYEVRIQNKIGVVLTAMTSRILEGKKPTADQYRVLQQILDARY